jgi:hypothetical protein
MSEKKHWLGEIPKACQICGLPIKEKFIDGATRYGPWAILCPSCHRDIGRGLGTGRGQEYTYNPETKHWEKTNG